MLTPGLRRPTGMTLGARLGAMTDQACASHPRALVALALLCLVFFVPGFFTVPPIDRDEARFAQASKQMIETGDLIDIRFQEEARHKKPVGIYWLQVGVVKAAETLGVPQARTTIWLYRIPSLLGATLGVFAVYWAGLAFGSRRLAFLAAGMLASSVLLGVEARLAKTDAVLFLTCTLAFGALARAYMAGRRDEKPTFLTAFVFWTALAGGILIKGPIIVMIVGLALVTLAIAERRGRWLLGLRPLLGLAWMALLVAPWFVAITLKTAGSFFEESVAEDLLGKTTSGAEGHWGPPGFHLAVFWVMFFPAAPLAILAAPYVWRMRKEPVTLFLLAWIVPSWLVFEAVPTKLPHYVLPLYPALAILIARGIIEDTLALGQVRLMRSLWMWPIFAFLIPIAFLAAHVALQREPAFQLWPFVAAAGLLGVWAWRFVDDDGIERGLLQAMAATAVMIIGIWGVAIPGYNMIWFNERLASRIERVGCPNPMLATTGVREPSLVFLYGTNLVMTNPAGAADFLAGEGCRAAFVTQTQLGRGFTSRAEQIGLRYKQVGRINGFAINGGRFIEILIFAKDAVPGS